MAPPRARRLALPALMAALLAVGFYLGAATELPARLLAWKRRAVDLRDAVRREGAAPVAARLAAAATAAPRRLVLDVKHTDHEMLRYRRERALRYGFIVTDEDSLVPARVSVDGKMHRVRVRLKGDLVDHLQGDKWSLRIETRGDDAIWGMRSFSIQSPERSAYLKEWFLHRWLAHEGLIGLRYDFVEVELNGRRMGIYALEESFGKELVEHNCRREGPLLKLDESGLMDPASVGLGDRRSHEDLYYAAAVTCFDPGKTLRSDDLRDRYTRGRALLEGLRARTIRAGDALDLPKAARLYAMFDVLQGGHHALRWKNVRFYYNPVLDRLELLAYNAYGLHRKREPVTSIFYQDWLAGDVGAEDVLGWQDVFFSDPRFVEAYFRELRRIAAPGYLEAFLARIEPEAREKLAIVNREYPHYVSPLPHYLGARNAVWEVLNPKRPVRAYLKAVDEDAGTLSLTIVNTSYLPVTVHALRCGDASIPSPPATFPGKLAGAPLEHRTITFAGLSPPLHARLGERRQEGRQLLLASAHLEYALEGGPAVSIPVEALPIEPLTAYAPSAATSGERLRRLAYERVIELSPFDRRIRFLPGSHRITSDVVIPAGFDVRGGPGTELLLERDAMLVSYSPVHFAGREDAPFVIGTEDGTGQGLTVLQAGGPSELVHVVIRGQSSPRKGLWQPTGAITFLESDVLIRDSRLSDCPSEDLLNTVRSGLRMENVLVSGTRSDALDADYCKVSISGGRFQDCGNDCIDVSGSTAEIRGVAIDGAGDKGISVGERSEASVVAPDIRGATIGIASKDGSTARIEGLRVTASATALAAYRKKGEFGGGSIDASDVVLADVTTPFRRDALSRIQVDGADADAVLLEGPPE